jgi:hypothetical protein
MSYTFSRALVEAYSQECCSDGGASVPSNGTPTLDQSWWPDKTTGHIRLSRYGMTFGPLTGVRGEALLTWWLEASRARTSQSQEMVTGSTGSGRGCGLNSSASFAKYDPAELKWKTRQCSLAGDLDEFSGTWPSWGLMRDGECWELPEWVPPMNGTASGSVPTPVASMSKGSSQKALTRKSGRSRERDRLDHYVMARDGGPLNPEYAEWLMGWPIGLTAIEPLETARFQQWLQQHGKSSEAVNE